MAQKMSWNEMQKKYPNEWLLIIDYETDASGRLIQGIVYKHSKSKNEVFAKPALNQTTAFRYTGESNFRGFRDHVERGYNL